VKLNRLKTILCSCTFAAATAVPGVQDTEAQPAAKGSLTVIVTGLRNDNGQVLFSLYNKAEGFPRDRSQIMQTAEVTRITSKQATVTFRDLPYGDYAVAILHDENRSGDMDYNLLHLPKEGYGFSNNVAVKLTPPAFKAAKFPLNAPRVTTSITARY
jgi:uncharacterized protein (DUF2141 family)